MTRTNDQNIGIVERAMVAKSARAEVFVSIHFNAAPADGPPAQGTETWIGEGHTAISRQLADAVQRSVVRATGYRDRGVKVGNVSGVIRPSNHDSRTANCLVEISCLDRQPQEEARLRQQGYIDTLGSAISDAVLSYLAVRGLAAGAAMGAEPEDAASARALGLITDDEFEDPRAPGAAEAGAGDWEDPPADGEQPRREGKRGKERKKAQASRGERYAPPRMDETLALGAEDIGPDFEARIGNGLRAIHRDLEAFLFARTQAAAIRAASDEAPVAEDMIVGVGIGPAMRDFESVGPDGPGAPVLNIYVSEPMSLDQAKALVVDSFGIQALSPDRQPVNIIRTGPIDAFGHRHRERPAPCGISVAHGDVTAGTLGVLARGRSADRRNRLLILSNNHVLANVDEARPGDAIIQQGPYDGGLPADQIAVLERWVPINFDSGADNYVDCATGWCWSDRVRPEFLYRRGNEWDYFRVGSIPTTAAVGMAVGKSDRTTQLTSGQIVDVSASITVNFGKGRMGNFRDQITIKGNNNVQFSQGGDSGSLIWTWESVRRPVGLLFAGGNQHTFANKIGRVMEALDIELVT